MGTRGIIAALTDSRTNTFIGRYHHQDSNPAALGKTLYEQYHLHFYHEVGAMMKFLLIDHPGWMTLAGKDFTLQPTYDCQFHHFDTLEHPPRPEFEHPVPDEVYYPAMREYDFQMERYTVAREQAIKAWEQSDEGRRPQCFCHGYMPEHEAYQPSIFSNMQEASESMCLYLYIFDEVDARMDIWKRQHDYDEWTFAGIVDLNAPEPDWKTFE